MTRSPLRPNEVHRLAGIAVGGLSVGGIETSIHFPELKLAFDIGRCPEEVVARDTVLFTHAHMDHMGGVAYHAATRALRNMRPPTYVVPANNVEAFEKLFDVWRELDRSDLPHETVPLSPGEEHVLRKNWVVRPFRSPHTAPCQGYGLYSRRHKLRAEFRELEGDELRKLREQGTDLTEAVEVAEVAFTGDTRIDVVEREEVVRTARLLVMETTFVDDRVSVDECRAKGHVHLDEVVERADLFENEAILLTHFSARYTPRDVFAALDAKLPPALRERVTPLLNRRG